MKTTLRLLSNVLIFAIGIWLIMSNRKTVGLVNLGKMILGMACLFFLLYRYNKRYTN